MKKRKKREFTFVPHEPKGEPDTASVLGKIQRQLVILEKKLDSLIAERESQPVQRPEAFPEKRLTKAICAECHKECEVPFRPTGNRPVYCRDCFSRHKPRESAFERHGGGRKPFNRRRR